jgi:Na+-driven multidrug efflux pump
VVYILLIGIFFNGLANLPYTALHSIGAAKYTGTLHIAELICYVPLLILLLRSLGLPGAALAWTLRTTTDCAFLFARYRLLHR